MISIQLSDQDWAVVAARTAHWSARAQFEITLNGLLQGWSDLVEEVEEGYSDCYDEYQNDLSARALLQELLTILSQSGKDTCVRMVAPLDERFIEATVSVGPPVPDPGDMWWWTRVPRVRSAELDRELRSLGYVLEDRDRG